ncbi:hypothetical protein FJZ31_32320 [Candidatus Poribacteria bacterium]|nr:hypothetical protein [Candidatus Poribacteria bacterium]
MKKNSVPVVLYENRAQFWREVELFEQKREELLKEYEGKYVALYNGEIIDFDDNEGRLVDRLLEKYGHETPIYIQHVSKEGIPIFNIPGIDID